MDERELATRFRAAPGDPPPPTFTLEDVTAASARARAHRRSAMIVAVGCVVLAMLGFGLTRMSFTGTTAGPAQLATGEQPADTFGPLPKASTPTPLRESGGTGEDGPRAEGATGCDKVDPALATALAGELPATGISGPSPGRVCLSGSRSAGFEVTDGDRTGFLSVTLVPPAVAIPLERGVATAAERAASGATIVVSSAPATGSAAPLEGDLHRIALALAARF